MSNFKILLKRGNHSEMQTKEADIMVLEKGELFLEYQDQYKDKWYKKFMNSVRIKIGDSKTIYKDLPFTNRKLKPIVQLCIEIGLITIVQIISVIMFFMAL